MTFYLEWLATIEPYWRGNRIEAWKVSKLSLKGINIFEEWALEDKALSLWLSLVPGLGGGRRIKGKKKKCWQGDRRWSKVEVLKRKGPRE